MRRPVLVFLIAAIAGFAGARFRPGNPPASTAPTSSPSPDPRAGRWQPQDLSAWAANKDNSFDAYRDEWRDWSDAELKTALDAAAKNPLAALGSGSEYEILCGLFGERMRRDPDAAMAWFDSLAAQSMKQRLAGMFAHNWPADRADEGLAYILAHRESFEFHSATASGEIIKGAIGMAARRGPEALDDLFRQLRENRLDPRYSSDWKFPADFDFAKLAASPETRRMMEKGGVFFAGIWMSRDREGAFRHLIADAPDDGKVSLSALFNDVLPKNDSPQPAAAAERAQWLAGQLATLPVDRQRTLATQAIGQLDDQPAALGHFLMNLTDEEVRAAAIAPAIERMLQRDPDHLIAFIETSDDIEWRIDTLAAMKVDLSLVGRLSPDKEQALREKLASWNTPPDRIQQIIGKFGKGGQ